MLLELGRRSLVHDVAVVEFSGQPEFEPAPAPAAVEFAEAGAQIAEDGAFLAAHHFRSGTGGVERGQAGAGGFDFLLKLGAPIAGILAFEVTIFNAAAFVMGLIGAALTYVLWFRGLARLDTRVASSLGFLSPVMAVLLGWVFLGQSLGWLQPFVAIELVSRSLGA